jgi:hypothetical protein
MNLMNEEALARLEAGLRAQREKLSGAPLQASPDSSRCEPIEIPAFLKRDVKEKSPVSRV